MSLHREPRKPAVSYSLIHHHVMWEMYWGPCRTVPGPNQKSESFLTPWICPTHCCALVFFSPSLNSFCFPAPWGDWCPLVSHAFTAELQPHPCAWPQADHDWWLGGVGEAKHRPNDHQKTHWEDGGGESLDTHAFSFPGWLLIVFFSAGQKRRGQMRG